MAADWTSPVSQTSASAGVSLSAEDATRTRYFVWATARRLLAILQRSTGVASSMPSALGAPSAVRPTAAGSGAACDCAPATAAPAASRSTIAAPASVSLAAPVVRCRGREAGRRRLVPMLPPSSDGKLQPYDRFGRKTTLFAHK